MHRLIASIKKEFLILVRDQAGLGLIFLMPVVLVLVMTLIQDATFRKMNNTNITLLYLDEDHDTLGIQVKQGLEKAGFFKLITSLKDQGLDEKTVMSQVAQGNYVIGVVVRPGSTEAIRARGQSLVEQALKGSDVNIIQDTSASARIIIYFDPAIQLTFKVTVRNALENFTSKIEEGIMFKALSDGLAGYLPEPGVKLKDPGSGIIYQEIYAADKYSQIIPNSVQHNVPAWTIFAMFFIIIPITGNLIMEKESGLATRLRVMPGNQLQALGAKISVYAMVGIVQFIILLVFAKLVFPFFQLPMLELGPEKSALFMMALATTLAATGYSVLVGTVAKTRDQAAVFGMVSVIIFAAIGGIWVPVFMMPDLMQSASIISPLNWSLDGFYDILLRGGGIREIAGKFCALIGFFAVTLIVAIYFSGRRDRQ
jgi:ABC-2 type transport system permease protein